MSAQLGWADTAGHSRARLAGNLRHFFGLGKSAKNPLKSFVLILKKSTR